LQVQRKRHIGNDIVVIVFQCPGAKPLDVSTFASKYTHSIIVVQASHPNTPELSYT
jgi:RAP1 GTPase activating protein 1